MHALLSTLILTVTAVNAASDFEFKLKAGLSSDFCRAMGAESFPAPADLAYLASLARGLPAAATFKPRDVRAIARGYSIGAPNGRTFTLTRDPASRDVVVVNGRRLTWRDRSLERFAADLDAALHRTFVTRHLPWLTLRSERAEALIPGILLFVGLTGYFVIQDWQSGGYARRVTAHYEARAKGCAAERKESGLRFDDSVTAHALAEISALEARDDQSTPDCPVWIERSLIAKGESLTPKFTPAERAGACAAYRKFMTCATALRHDRTRPVIQSSDAAR